jgi:hypothetical protein
MRPLADELTVPRVVPSITDESGAAHTQKRAQAMARGALAHRMSPAFVAAMEDVLDLDAEHDDPRRPVVAFDERPLHLLDHARDPIPAAPERRRKVDYEYRCNGTGIRS